jgi:hypothetical protein
MVKDHSYTTVIDSIEFIGVIEIFHLLGWRDNYLFI